MTVDIPQFDIKSHWFSTKLEIHGHHGRFLLMCCTSELRDTEEEEAVLRWANPTFMGPSLSLLQWVEL
jgi:hypothetical protein